MKNTIINIATILYKKKKYVWLVATVLICMGYAALLSNKTMPFAEGWYTYYAQCINDGKIVYKDFDYLFTPFYIYFISLFTKIFGYNIIALRVFGVLIFGTIGGIIYSIFSEIFDDEIAFVASISSAYFMQSEIVQVFYDYVRIMDVFSCLTILFLIKAIKNIDDLKNKKHFIIIAGLMNSFFILVKQNMGIVFMAFAIVLIIASSIVKKKKIKEILFNVLYFIIGIIIPVAFTCILMLFNGSLLPFFNQTGSEAIAAKGGIMEILFGWLINNKQSFTDGMKFAIIMLLIIAVSYYLKTKSKLRDKTNWEGLNVILSVLYAISIIGGVFIFTRVESVAKIFDGHATLSTYSLFLIVTMFFLFTVIKTIIDFVNSGDIAEKNLCYITVTGAYFAISFGCGMSAGLSEGQAAIGVAFVISVILDNLNFRFSQLFKIIVVGICILFTLQSAAKKMNYTYNWWGLDDAKYWDNVNKSEDIDILKGINMSAETLSAYETIYNVISEKTKISDPIYCFPQIPIFYSICDRKDPGVRAKVQWFDVASDKSIENDMEVIQKNKPKAILIYETSEYAYSSHESLFRAGEISATRKMKNFLLSYVQENAYTFYGRINAGDNNSFLLYYMDVTNNKGYSFKGKGTKDNPFIVDSAEALVELSKQVANGNDFSKRYFIQSCDIDMSMVNDTWKPIGEYNSGFYFKGIYDGNGHVIKNLKYYAESDNIGLFGQLGGVVCNLGVIDSEFSGGCVGVIASHSLDENAKIINCYTDSIVNGTRAGGIADNFSGSIINCVSYSNCIGIDSAGAVSYSNGNVINVYGKFNNLETEIFNSFGNPSVQYCTDEYIDNYLLYRLNEKVANISWSKDYYSSYGESYNAEKGVYYEEWMGDVSLCNWTKEDNEYPKLISK